MYKNNCAYTNYFVTAGTHGTLGTRTFESVQIFFLRRLMFDEPLTDGGAVIILDYGSGDTPPRGGVPAAYFWVGANIFSSTAYV